MESLYTWTWCPPSTPSRANIYRGCFPAQGQGGRTRTPTALSLCPTNELWVPRTPITVYSISPPVFLQCLSVGKKGIYGSRLQASLCLSVVSAKRLEIPEEAFDATQTQPDVPAALLSSCPKDYISTPVC